MPSYRKRPIYKTGAGLTGAHLQEVQKARAFLFMDHHGIEIISGVSRSQKSEKNTVMVRTFDAHTLANAAFMLGHCLSRGGFRFLGQVMSTGEFSFARTVHAPIKSPCGSPGYSDP